MTKMDEEMTEEVLDRIARGERTAATFATIARTFRFLSDADRTAQLIAFGVLYQTGLRWMQENMNENGREHIVANYGCTPDELEREVRLLTDKVHEQGR